jgi:CO/xanthine dehydrogenase Mo-binding subunit
MLMERSLEMSDQNQQALEMLKTALSMEEEGEKFYKKAMESSKNDLGRAIFETLMKDERVHYGRILKIYNELKDKSAWTDEWKSMDVGHKDVTELFRGMAAKHGETLETDPGELEALDVGTGESKVVVAEAFYDPPTEMLDREFKGNLSCTYAFGATGVEVEVDEKTGEVKILQLYAAHDVGKAINPTLIKGQIYGAGYIGVGYGLTEEMKLERGRVVNPNFLDYKMLTAKDNIPVTPMIIETDEKDGPYGAKGIGEPGLVPTAPAIANAVYDAVGVRITDLPITPEKVLKALKEKREGK